MSDYSAPESKLSALTTTQRSYYFSRNAGKEVKSYRKEVIASPRSLGF